MIPLKTVTASCMCAWCHASRAVQLGCALVGIVMRIYRAIAEDSVLYVKTDSNVEIEQGAIHRNVWHSNDTPRDPSWPGRQFDQRHKL